MVGEVRARSEGEKKTKENQYRANSRGRDNAASKVMLHTHEYVSPIEQNALYYTQLYAGASHFPDTGELAQVAGKGHT